MSKERPILFSGAMVRAILEGRKTQTRRVIKFDSKYASTPVLMDAEEPHYWAWGADHYTCPYGQIGDRLWVRETWFCDQFELLSGPYLETDNAKDNLYYAADDPDGDITNLIPECDLDGREHIRRDRRANIWKPSIHMPRWASRTLLEVTEIRVERVQDISEDDAEDEGVLMPEVKSHEANGWTFKDGYKSLWNSINANRGFGWEVNPWAWAISFKIITSANLEKRLK